MQEFMYTPVNGHAVASIHGRKFLIEPGMSYSLAERPLLLDGKRIDVLSNVQGLSMADINSSVGIELDGVLGANVTDQFTMSIYPDSHHIELDHYLKDFPIDIDVENLAGLACMSLSISGQQIKGFLSVGSRLSFIHPKLVQGLNPIGRDTEIFGFIGMREFNVYTLPVMIDRQVTHLKFGEAPPEAAAWLELANVQSALGCELLEHYAVSLSLNEGVLGLDPLAPIIH